MKISLQSQPIRGGAQSNAVAEVESSLDDAFRHELVSSEENAKFMMRAEWLTHMMGLLRRTRIKRGISQEDLALALQTSQSRISNLERAEDTTLGRFWDYLYACGEFPAVAELVGAAEARQFMITHPDFTPSVSNFVRYRAQELSAETMQDLEEQRDPAMDSIDKCFVENMLRGLSAGGPIDRRNVAVEASSIARPDEKSESARSTSHRSPQVAA